MRNDDHWEKQLEQLPLGSGGFSVDSMNKIKERIRLNRKSGTRPRRIIVAMVTIVSVAAVAWTLNRGMQPQQLATESKLDETEAQLIVQYWDSQSFMSQIGQPYMIRHPNIDFKIVTSPNDDLASYRKWIEETNVDVLQIPLTYIDDLAKDGAIVPMDDMLKRDRVDLDEMYQPMIDLMRDAGGGKLYALVDQFSTDLLFYNKSLFQSHRIPLPEEGDTWDDIFRLAQRFSGSTADGMPVYGLSFGWQSDPYHAIMKVGRSEGLSLVDTKGLPQVASDAWRKVWSQVTEGFEEGWINNEPSPEPTHIDYIGPVSTGWTEQSIMEADTFINNRAAMSFQSYSSTSSFLSKAINNGIFTGEWDALPVSSIAAPGQTRSFGGAVIYAINSKSPNIDQGMKFIEYIVSKEQAERDYVAGNYVLHANRPTSVTIANDPADRVYSAKLDAAAILEQLERNQLPGVSEMSAALNAKGAEAVQSIIAGRSTVDETLAQLQEDALLTVASSKR